VCSTKREVNGRVLACVCERRDNDCGNEAYSLQLHVVCATLPTVQKCVPKNLVLRAFYHVFTARCYASAVLAMGLCLSVSVCHKS